MKPVVKLILVGLVFGLGSAYSQEQAIKPEEKNTKSDKNVQTTVIESNESNSSLLMKIPSDDQEDQARKKALLDELRKLYKANFL